jgi:hypothetical protein
VTLMRNAVILRAVSRSVRARMGDRTEIYEGVRTGVAEHRHCHDGDDRQCVLPCSGAENFPVGTGYAV